MALPCLFFLLSLIIQSHLPTTSSSSPLHTLTKGSSIYVNHKDDNLVSPNGLFTAGFYKVGINAYCFSIWFTQPPAQKDNYTVVWTANRDLPVAGKHSRLSLQRDGNLVLEDADHSIVWSTETKSTTAALKLQLRNTGNLVLGVNGDRDPLWQSFDYPTDTLLPDQSFTRNSRLVSSRSATNFSSGFFELYFENNNILSLLYNGPEITSVYWPEPYLKTWEAGRSTYNNSRIARLDSNGQFNSSDEFGFLVSDFGTKRSRLLKLDSDGNIRVYSLVDQKEGKKWDVQWQAFSAPCKIHGVCGANSLCTYTQHAGRKCACVPGYKKKNLHDWSHGCEPVLKPCQQGQEDLVELQYAEFYGYDFAYHQNFTLEACKNECLKDCNCKGFQFKFDDGYYSCFLKNLLYNGHQLGFQDSMYVKIPKQLVSSVQHRFINGSSPSCPGHLTMRIPKSYEQKHENGSLKVLLWFGVIVGTLEILFIVVFLYISREDSTTTPQSYFPITPGFKRFTYTQLKKATRNFKEEIGRGGAGVVYKAELADDRTAAIKVLKEATHQGEAEFQAEINIIGRLNHMNLTETWGYCVEGKHRLVVYEYMENGSLAKSLQSSNLDWGKKIEIAVGTAKGLAYLHEECLEWVLHCDVKPHNILLDADYNPKVADFGLSKLFDRSGSGNSSFSRIRGTRGYMAPEWVFNLPITSKVDVYSYGVVILEMITGKSPLEMQQTSVEVSGKDQTLAEWVREKMHECYETGSGTWVEKVLDGATSGEYDRRVMKNMVKVALQCVEEDRDARPTMSQVVNMLVLPDIDDS